LADEETAMPRHELLCEKCQKPFELIMTTSEREKTRPTCPKCKGSKVTPRLSGFMAPDEEEELIQARHGGLA
jgi:putative FmdB family regulatory protein